MSQRRPSDTPRKKTAGSRPEIGSAEPSPEPRAAPSIEGVRRDVRIDQWLSGHGLAHSRTHGAALIEQGQVEIRDHLEAPWKKISKPSHKLPADLPIENIRVLDGPANRYVSRGGLKLEGALGHTGLAIEGWRILDVGTSTGGFADCCLQMGAAQVIGIDVGHGQLARELTEESRLQLFEGINARNLLAARNQVAPLQEPFDLIVGDLSFISILPVLPQLPALLEPEGRILFLVKPQFELDSSALNKNGIVKDPRSYDIVKNRVLQTCHDLGLLVDDYFDSSIEGKDGNKEFFLFARIHHP
jgi:23S rRNA (cytidine1920-2'-O)/16S rRNA (cytidine1409-2'-O)-methyltransferase